MPASYPHKPTVFVLGAGATKAFLPRAPLMVDDYELERLLSLFTGFSYAYDVLQWEKAQRPNGLINIERLMTRLDGFMPYDAGDPAMYQLGLLLAEVKSVFIRRIALAREGPFYRDELSQLARICVKQGITCITFNYDDVLDQALWEVDQVVRDSMKPGSYWHPDGGYGFFCRPSDVTVSSHPGYMDKTSMHLLKLHGSINWYARRGTARPYDIQSVMHDEEWYPPSSVAFPHQELIRPHLEPDPFIVPPVLIKSALTKEPLLKLVWALAKDCLERAHSIVFIGYSMPSTDLAASYLFGEALEGRDHCVKVVNLSAGGDEREALIRAYKKVFPKIAENQFEFKDALQWSAEFVGTAQNEQNA